MAKTKVHGEYLDPSVISGQTQVTAVGADSVLILDATDNALKKALLSDVIETVGSTPTFSQISASSDLTVDVGGSIILDADGTGIVDFKDGGTHIGRIENASSDFKLEARVQDKDIVLVGNDGGTGIEALRLDMSNAGKAAFNAGATFASDVVVGGTSVDAAGTVSLKSDGNIRAVGASSTAYDTLIGAISGVSNGFHIVQDTSDNQTYNFYTGSQQALTIDGSGIVINESSADKDFRVESDGNANMLFVDGGNNRVGISNSSPAAVLHVGGNGITVNSTLDISRTAIFRTEDTGNYSTSGNNSAAHAATFMRGNSVATGDQVGHSYVFNNGGWSATAEIMAEVESASTAYSRLNFKTWNGSMATRQVITSAGYVVKAYQPYIRCAGNQSSMAANQGTTADYSNWADQVQRGITRSGAVFTVPIAGEYLITYSFYNWMNNTGKGVSHGVFLKKGSTSIQETNNEFDMGDNNYSYYDNNLSNSIILNMAAGDTFKFTVYADIYGGATHTNMSAYLLG